MRTRKRKRNQIGLSRVKKYIQSGENERDIPPFSDGIRKN